MVREGRQVPKFTGGGAAVCSGYCRCGVPAAAQGKFQIQGKPEPNALSTIKYTGMNDNVSKSLCCY